MEERTLHSEKTPALWTLPSAQAQRVIGECWENAVEVYKLFTLLEEAKRESGRDFLKVTHGQPSWQ